MTTSTTSALDQVTDRRRGTGLIAYDPERSPAATRSSHRKPTAATCTLIAPDGSVAHQWTLPQRPGTARSDPAQRQPRLQRQPSRHAQPLSGLGNVARRRVFRSDSRRRSRLVARRQAPPSRRAVARQRRPALHDGRSHAAGDAASRSSGGSHAHDSADGKQYADVVKRVDRVGHVPCGNGSRGSTSTPPSTRSIRSSTATIGR